MSNRIRIMFRGPNDGPYCHSGNRALRALEEVYLGAPRQSTKRGWIADYQLKPGQKVYNSRNSFMGPGRYFLVDLPAEGKPDPVPEDLRKGKFQLASWLWSRLPKELQTACVLVITREARGADWRQSLANPSRIGNQPYCDKKKAEADAVKQTLEEAVFKKKTYDEIVAEHILGAKWQPSVQTQGPLQANKPLKTKTAKQLAAEKVAFYTAHGFQKKKPSPWPVEEPDFYDGPIGEIPAPVAGAQGQAGKMPPKVQKSDKPTKPRLGIWS